MATRRRSPVDATAIANAVALRVALRWATHFAWQARHPDCHEWSFQPAPPPDTASSLADHYLAEVSALVGYEVDDDEAARLWALISTTPPKEI